MAIIAVLCVAALVAVDQLAKIWAIQTLRTATSVVVVLQNFLGFTFVENRGAAFGILQGARWFFVVLTLVVLGGMAYVYPRMPKTKTYGWVRFALILIAAGAIGNFIDRLLKGYVVDFLMFLFIEFPVFNIADIFVVCGTLLLAVVMLFFIKDEQPPAKPLPEDKV